MQGKKKSRKGKQRNKCRRNLIGLKKLKFKVIKKKRKKKKARRKKKEKKKGKLHRTAKSQHIGRGL